MAKVDPYGCWDGVGNGVPGDEEFESILSILDFPMESLEDNGFVGDWDVSKSQYLGPIPSDVLIGPPTVALSRPEPGPPVLMHRQVSLIDATPETKLLPYQFEETPSSYVLREKKCIEVQEQGVFQSQSPVSVLENNGSSLAGKSSLIRSQITKRNRSKRARPSGVNPWLLISPLFSSSCTSRNTYSARKVREGRKKISLLERTKKTIQDSSDVAQNSYQTPNHSEEPNVAASRYPAVTKKCAHCEVTRTPQWREGPMGPKTLCNACGVRYRSGRLYPEYRPAASPTFVPSLHSNSHKKVIEMRTKGKQQQVTKIEQPSLSPELEFIPVSGYFFDPIC